LYRGGSKQLLVPVGVIDTNVPFQLGQNNVQSLIAEREDGSQEKENSS